MARIGFKLELCCCCECVGLQYIPCGVLPVQLALVGAGLDWHSMVYDSSQCSCVHLTTSLRIQMVSLL